jgi:hypothetical protein
MKAAWSLAVKILFVSLAAIGGAAIRWKLDELWHAYHKLPDGSRMFVSGALDGAAVGVLLILIWPWIRRAQWREWELTEVELHGLKFTSDGGQRRAARRLFFELATRITTRPMDDMAGDDGKALASLYSFVITVREVLTDVPPSRGTPDRSVEIYALDLINRRLSPFLSKWHVEWDSWHNLNPMKHCHDWPQHDVFRHELRGLQAELRERALGLAKIGIVPGPEKLLSAV